MNKLYQEYRKAMDEVRAADDEYLRLRDAKSDGCCVGLSLIGVLAYDAKIMRAYQELLDCIIKEEHARRRLGENRIRSNDPICQKIREILALSEQERQYIKDLCDMTLDEADRTGLEAIEIEELENRIEYDEFLDSTDINNLLELVSFWGSSEPMYAEDFVDGLNDKIRDARMMIKEVK